MVDLDKDVSNKRWILFVLMLQYPLTSLYENQFPKFKCIGLDFLMENLFSIKRVWLLDMKFVSFFHSSWGNIYLNSFYKHYNDASATKMVLEINYLSHGSLISRGRNTNRQHKDA